MSNISNRVVGDRLATQAAVLLRNGSPRDLTGMTVSFVGLTAAGAAWITETSSNVTAQASVTFTVDTDRDELIANAHGLVAGDEVTVSSTTTLPTGLVAATRYFVRDISPNRFKVALTPGDVPVNLSASGSGTHSYKQLGYVEYAYQTGETGTAGDYKAWFVVTSGGLDDTHPATAEGIVITIVAQGS